MNLSKLFAETARKVLLQRNTEGATTHVTHQVALSFNVIIPRARKKKRQKLPRGIVAKHNNTAGNAKKEKQ